MCHSNYTAHAQVHGQSMCVRRNQAPPTAETTARLHQKNKPHDRLSHKWLFPIYTVDFHNRKIGNLQDKRLGFPCTIPHSLPAGADTLAKQNWLTKNFWPTMRHARYSTPGLFYFCSYWHGLSGKPMEDILNRPIQTEFLFTSIQCREPENCPAHTLKHRLIAAICFIINAK